MLNKSINVLPDKKNSVEGVVFRPSFDVQQRQVK